MRHTIDPIFDENSRILILGSFPSVRLREVGFYYGHPRNRFWLLISVICGCEVPTSVEDKKSLLLAHGIALWDVIASCEVTGSADTSIKNVVPNDVYAMILSRCSISCIFLNGGTAGRLFEKYFPEISVPHTILPSTSPANAAFSFERLIQAWSVIGDHIPHGYVNNM